MTFSFLLQNKNNCTHKSYGNCSVEKCIVSVTCSDNFNSSLILMKYPGNSAQRHKKAIKFSPSYNAHIRKITSLLGSSTHWTQLWPKTETGSWSTFLFFW